MNCNNPFSILSVTHYYVLIVPVPINVALNYWPSPPPLPPPKKRKEKKEIMLKTFIKCFQNLSAHEEFTVCDWFTEEPYFYKTGL